MILLGTSLIILALLLSVVSGMGKAFYDISNHGKFHRSIFDNPVRFNPNWWDSRITWMNKNKGNKARRTYLVTFTDAWHTAQFIMMKCFLAAPFFSNLGIALLAGALSSSDYFNWVILPAAIWLSIGQFTIINAVQTASFHVCYRNLFMKPEHKKTIL